VGARVLAVAAAHARILARRRTALLLLALLPLAFYGALYRHSPHAITTAGVLSAFSAGGALILGRLLVLELAALGISAVTSAVMIAGTRPAHPGEVLAGVILTGAVAVPLGLALGALLPRELEAVLVLIGIVGIQVTTQPDTVISKLLPFHAAAQLLDAATSTPVTLWPRLAASVGYAAALLAITWAAWRRRATARHATSPPSPACEA